MGPGFPQDVPDAPDPDWPGDWPDEDQRADPGMIRPPGRAGRASAGGPPGRPRPLAVIAVAVTALAVGAGVALAVTGGSTPSSPPRATAPSVTAPGSGSHRSGQIPGGGTSGTGGAEQIFVGGKVLAVSDSSITIGGPDREITAAVTRSTRITGRVRGIQGVKNGDLVTARIAQSGGAATVIALQDPAEPPSAGSLP
jgi:hypothetical protein